MRILSRFNWKFSNPIFIDGIKDSMKIGMELLSGFLSPNGRSVHWDVTWENLVSGVYRELLSASIRRCTLSTSQDPFQADPELI